MMIYFSYPIFPFPVPKFLIPNFTYRTKQQVTLTNISQHFEDSYIILTLNFE